MPPLNTVVPEAAAPEDPPTPPAKRARIEGCGATLVRGGATYAEALAASRARRAETGAMEVHAYDHPAVLAGQGTTAREFEHDAPELTHVLVATGGGGLIGSLIAFVLSFVPPAQIAVGSPTTYIAILIGGNVLFVIVPLALYAIRKPHWQTADGATDFEPFTWQKEGREPGTEQGTTPAPAFSASPAPASPAAKASQ